MTDVAVEAIAHDPDSRDHFEVIGLPHRLVIDQEKLTEHYHALSRAYHPDFHQTGTPAERIASLRRTAAVNDAYKTLRDPVARGRWWLEHHGRKLGSNTQVPSDLATFVFEVQELIERFLDSRDAALAREVDERRREVDAERARRMDELAANFARWDERQEGEPMEGLLDELQKLLAEISYLSTLSKDLDRAAESVATP